MPNFDALEDLIKARKAKGLDNWDRLKHLAGKLSGKKSSDITFTCAHPKHGAGGEKHNLGSVEGNLHFMLGYVNPGFHLAPYHWHVIYPELDEAEAISFAAEQQHPSKPRFWQESKLVVSMEGDLQEGRPHTYAYAAKEAKDKADRSMKATTRYGSYYADPVTQTIYEPAADKAYNWDLVKNSYFAYENPKIKAAMEAASLSVTKSYKLPEMVRQLSEAGSWASDVYPLVKSLFPKPGSVVLLRMGQETIYGLVKSDQISLVDEAGHSVAFTQYDRQYSTLDLTKGGDLHPSILYNFAVAHLGVDAAHLIDVVKSRSEQAQFDYPTSVEGQPSPGYVTQASSLDEETYTQRSHE